MKKTRIHNTIFLPLFFVALVYCIAAPILAEGYSCQVHESAVDQAYDLWIDEPWMLEIGAYKERIKGGACSDTHAEDYVNFCIDDKHQQLI